MKVLLTRAPKELTAVNPEITIEAEYGEKVVEGSLLTLAHHGERSENPAPCVANIPKIKIKDSTIIGVSHIDLDTLGGISKVLNTDITSEEYNSFWELAAFVDVNGPHKLSEAKASEKDIRKLYAFWAWSQEHRCPRSEGIVDVTDYVEGALAVLKDILVLSYNNLIQDGISFLEKEEELNASSFVEVNKGVIVRVSNFFVNHLYTIPENIVGYAVLSYNPTKRNITLSFADGGKAVDACKIMQTCFGPEAGGHPGIAGSSRDKEMALRDIFVVLDKLQE